jgi:hypothetical protein
MRSLDERKMTMTDNKAMDSKTTSTDDLTKTTAKNSVELTEEELSKASGGFLKINLTQVEVTSYQLGGSHGDDQKV